jgi:hypothetical protein
MDKHYIKSKTNYKQALEENTIMQTKTQITIIIIIIIIITIIPPTQMKGMIER